MERKTKIRFDANYMKLWRAKQIMGRNFIGPEELKKIAGQMNLADPFLLKTKIPEIPFKDDLLKRTAKDYVLILGMPADKNGKKLTLNNLRSFLGFDPEKGEPCFYNQDWYLKEKFASKKTLNFKWYLVKKSVQKNSRGKRPEEIKRDFGEREFFPSAILTVFTFFANYFLNNGEILWPHDFIWCSDKDKNGDLIYTGRYLDPKKINKNGFNVHRHLSLRSCHGLAPEII